MASKTEIASFPRETERMILWALSAVPQGRLPTNPPHGKHLHAEQGFKTYFRGWSALRQFFLWPFYEENYAIPAMQSFMDRRLPNIESLYFFTDNHEARCASTV